MKTLQLNGSEGLIDIEYDETAPATVIGHLLGDAGLMLAPGMGMEVARRWYRGPVRALRRQQMGLS